MKTVKRILSYTGLIFLALFLTGPFIWMIFVAFKSSGNVFKIADLKDFLPFPATFSNFIQVMKDVPLIPQFLLNTIWICFWGVFLELLIASLAAYPLARLEFPGRNFIFAAMLATLMLPAQANMIVNFITIRKLGLFDTYLSIFLPSLVSVFGIFLMRQAYIVIPRELEDAARIDGCGELGIWYRIMLPLTRPSMATLAIFSFVSYWNTFMWPLVILKHEAKYPLAVGLSYLSNMFASNFRAVAAGSVLSMVPIIIVFVIMQRHFIKGIMAGSIK
ncbi:MAG: carbohydrate ABC transporter permease [Firmicutes bacterium]|nr:carbohydrate ABC transporter permease [Bacillota bacterium]